MIAGLAGTLPRTLTRGLQRSTACRTPSPSTSARCRRCPRCSPPCSASIRCSTCSLSSGSSPRCRRPASRSSPGREFFPQLISGPFHHGLVDRLRRGRRARRDRRRRVAAARRPVRPSGRDRLEGVTEGDGRSASQLPSEQLHSPPFDPKETPVPDTVPAIDPGRTALLVMDYQTGILGRLPDAAALLARASEAIGIARDRGAHDRLRPRGLHRRGLRRHPRRPAGWARG